MSSDDRETLERLAPRHDPLPPEVSWDPRADVAGVEARWRLLAHATSAKQVLANDHVLARASEYTRSIESFIGALEIPIGLAGPLRVCGSAARGDFYVPLATTEAALVASFNRGAQLISISGGCSVAVTDERVTRTPGFAFARLADAIAFSRWILGCRDELERIAATTTRHGRLVGVRAMIDARVVYVRLELATGDAAGQNIATLACDAICRHVVAESPVGVAYHMHDANLSGEKKANYASLQSVRGRRASAEVTIAADDVARLLHATPLQIERAWRMAAIGCVWGGSVGIHGQYANGLCALFLACGQDPACVAEATIGVTRVELDDAGDLYASVTLPNLIVGTVGGATALPTQRACLEILGLVGTGHARAFAEVCAAVCLAGELSVLGALASHEFAAAHRALARLRGARR